LIYLENIIGNDAETEKKIPGKVFRWKDNDWIRLGSTRYILYNPTFININEAKLYHSNQSLKARIFFQFRAYRLEDTPYANPPECNDSDNNDNKLNLILNAKFDHEIWQFLMKEPICVKQQWEISSNNNDIKQAFDNLFNGFIKEFEQDNNMNIPAVISNLIKKQIKVGSAIFFCKGFYNPLSCVSEDPDWDPIVHQKWLSF